MHHRGQLMTMERMIGHVPHLTRQMQERMAQMQAAAQTAGQARDRRPGPTMRRRAALHRRHAPFLRALKRNNRREWFNAHRDDYEAHVRQPMTVVVERLARRSSRLRAGARGEPEAVDVSHLPRHALLRKQDAVQDARRRGLSVRAACRSTKAPACTSTCRPTRSGSAAACTRRRRRSSRPSASTSPPT